MTITIVAITNDAHELTAHAIERTLQNVSADRILIISDRKFYDTSDYVEIDTTFNYKSHADFMIFQLVNHITTDHALIVQYDGMAVNKKYWTDEFLAYDYIGAPWLWRPTGKQVGNGGFSLRSRGLIETVAKYESKFSCNEDEYICDILRPQLESTGLKFADVSLASQFSSEREAGYRHSFGFHGSFNVPFYLDDNSIKQFIDLMPNRSSSGQLELIAYCFYCGKNDLAEYAINLAREEQSDFDEIFLSYLHSVPGRFNFLLNKII